MRMISLLVLLIFVISTGASNRAIAEDREWQGAKVVDIQLVTPPDKGDHWEYLLISNGLAYRVANGHTDSPYLNSSLGDQVKIASTKGSDRPFDSDSVYVMDAQGHEHKMELKSVVSAEGPCNR